MAGVRKERYESLRRMGCIAVGLFTNERLGGLWACLLAG